MKRTIILLLSALALGVALSQIAFLLEIKLDIKKTTDYIIRPYKTSKIVNAIILDGNQFEGQDNQTYVIPLYIKGNGKYKFSIELKNFDGSALLAIGLFDSDNKEFGEQYNIKAYYNSTNPKYFNPYKYIVCNKDCSLLYNTTIESEKRFVILLHIYNINENKTITLSIRANEVPN